ncbi:hypothetical protein DFH94DRAFT_208371 [Russula ochroleuca]|uniref:Uncharacterized protein n=1 Tax=Russula ochroleuca TaxID=152965 RepID=A0A9P5JXL9_9AGAM|nr:hypothetical protein DFH94DRAFT_208371 [Russula ochroleuca]
MQSQLNRPLSYNGAFSRGVYPPSVHDSITPGFTQSATPHYGASSFAQHGPTPVPTGPGIGRRNDVYGEGLIPGYEFNYSMAGSWEVPAPQPHNQSGYMMPNVQYDNVGQSRVNYAVNDFAADQFPNPAILLSPLLSGAYSVPNNQGAFPPSEGFPPCEFSARPLRSPKL